MGIAEGNTEQRCQGIANLYTGPRPTAAQCVLESGHAPPCRSRSLNAAEPPPKPADGPAIWDLVIADMRERDGVGAAKYGRRLRAGDGRDSLVDAYQEALDLVVYLRKAIEERDRTA